MRLTQGLITTAIGANTDPVAPCWKKRKIVQCIHVASLWSKDRIQERNEDAAYFLLHAEPPRSWFKMHDIDAPHHSRYAICTLKFWRRTSNFSKYVHMQSEEHWPSVEIANHEEVRPNMPFYRNSEISVIQRVTP